MDIRRRRDLRTVLAGSLIIGGLTTLSVAATTALTIGTASATPATLFSSTTAGSYAVTVPGGVTSVTIVAVGGTGGTGDGASGGEGAVMTVNAAVTPGDSLSVAVGADGLGAYGDQAGGAGTGAGGSGQDGAVFPVFAGGGGGGSAVYDGSVPLVVAGGGGGGGNYSSWGGNADQNGNGEIDGVDYAGQAGTLTGGPGAAGYFCCYTDIGYGVGMDGGEGAGGGGGGGGYWGGGGGSGLDGYPIYPVDFIFGGGGGASYPSPATVWDTTATPSVTITTASGFGIITTGQPSAKPGMTYGPVTLQAGNLGTSTSPYTTTVKWFGAELPKGLTLSSAGVLSGTPSTNLRPGTYSVVVQATETVTTLSGRTKVKTPTTVQAAIPLTITSTGPAEGDFTVATSSLSSATPGTAYGPVTLQAGNLGTSTSPYTTTVKWFGAELPRGLTLSSDGVLSGTPSTNLMPGTYSVEVQATETVTTLSGRTKVKTPTTVQAAIPLTIT